MRSLLFADNCRVKARALNEVILTLLSIVCKGQVQYNMEIGE